MTKEKKNIKKYKRMSVHFKRKYIQRYLDIIYSENREIANVLFNELQQEVFIEYGIESFYRLRDSVMTKIKNDDIDEYYRLLNR